MYFITNLNKTNNKMGFYECVHDCGDNNYCVSIGSSLDNFSSTDWIFCPKHQSQENRNLTYNLCNFLRRYSKKFCRDHICKIKIVETKVNSKETTLIKAELFGVNVLDLKLENSRKIYFTEFNEEPAWNVIDGRTFIIVPYENIYSSVDSPMCKDQNIQFDWSKYQVYNVQEQSAMIDELSKIYLEFLEKHNIVSKVFLNNLKCTEAYFGKRGMCVCIGDKYDARSIRFSVRKKQDDQTLSKSISLNYDNIYSNIVDTEDSCVNQLDCSEDVALLIDEFYEIVRKKYDSKVLPNFELLD